MITVDEFQEYVDSFQKEKGKYTLDELLQIGVKFKQLPRSQRSWKILHDTLGIYNITPAGYRKRVERYMKKNAFQILEEEEKEIPAKTAEEEGKEFRDAYIQQQKVRDWYNAYRRDIREEVRIENLKDEINNAANKFSKLESKKWDTSKLYVAGNEAVLLLSDLHIGVDCANYYNKYNEQIAENRLEKLARSVRLYCENNKVEILHILNLGDLINGIIHTNARIEAQYDVAEQIIVAGNLISKFMSAVVDVAPKITYRSVFDNHSRAIANKNEHVEKEQFSRIIDWFIKERLKDTSIEFYENEIDGGIGKLTLKSGKCLMFCHGHNDGKNNSYQNFIGLTQNWVDYICMAHYHNPAAKEFQGCKVFINGSIVGTESYAFGRRLFAKPSQKLLIFQEKCDDVVDIDISLS